MLATSLLITNLAAIAGAVVLLWLVSLALRDVSIVDIFWGSGFVLVAWLSWYRSEEPADTRPLLLLLVTTWGLRLALYLGWRNLGKGEDYRYQEMREKHGARFPLVSLFTVFLLQGLIMWIVSLPVQVGIERGGTWNWLRVVGALLWLAGFLCETIGDWQLATFKADASNRGKVMNRGLWRYTRHPNYFGDFLVWWGLYLVAVESNSWWWTAIGPLLMSVLLIRVSGVRLLESSLADRLEGYREYVARTSSFFPLPPRSGAAPAAGKTPD